MMKLTKNNIKFVKQRLRDGLTYNYYVAMKSNNISDNRLYCNYENNKSTADYYEFERLPKTVQKFVKEKYKAKSFFYTEEYYEEEDNDGLHRYGVYTFE